MIIDKHLRLFGKISLVDILLVCAAAALVFYAGIFAQEYTASAAPGDTRFTYTIELNKRDPRFKNNITIGDTLYDSLKGTEIGKIVDVYSLPSEEDVPDYKAGVIKRAVIEGLDNIYIVVEAANVTVTDLSTSIGPYSLTVGKDVYVRTKSFAASGYIVIMES